MDDGYSQLGRAWARIDRLEAALRAIAQTDDGEPAEIARRALRARRGEES